MDNFNLKGFLVENKLTPNSKRIKEEVQGQEVLYGGGIYDEDTLFVIQAKYPNMQSAIEGVKKYLDSGQGPVTFKSWYDEDDESGQGDILSDEKPRGKGAVYHLKGPGEQPGEQPPLLVSVKDSNLVTDPAKVAQIKAETEESSGNPDYYNNQY